MNLYGLIGYPLKHSWSSKLFNERFRREDLDCHYKNFELERLDQLDALMEEEPDLCGFNVTMPYKEAIITLLDEIDPVAKEIGAVNTVKVDHWRLKGYNTDVDGFEVLLQRGLKIRSFDHAIVLGTGGASKAVQYVLRQHQIPYSVVSRTQGKGDLTYEEITDEMLKENHLIINATPVGMGALKEEWPDIRYHVLTNKHVLLDLIYNPKETSFMSLGANWGAKTFNGLQMLYAQADKSWEIWNNA